MKLKAMLKRPSNKKELISKNGSIAFRKSPPFHPASKKTVFGSFFVHRKTATKRAIFDSLCSVGRPTRTGDHLNPIQTPTTAPPVGS
jgi:hypothetical protein